MALKVNGKGRETSVQGNLPTSGKSLVFEPKLLPLSPSQLVEKKPPWRLVEPRAQGPLPPAPRGRPSPWAPVLIHGTAAFLGMMPLKTLGP